MGGDNGVKSRKRFIILIGVLAALVIGLIILFIIRKSNERMGIITFYDESNNVTNVYVDDKFAGEMEGMAYIVARNKNDSGVYFSNDNSTVYALKNKKIKEVAEAMNFLTVAINTNVALMTNDDGHLYMYDGKKLNVIVEEKVNCAAISGNGKIYSYTLDNDSYFGEKIGKETKVEDCIITNISNNGKYIYGVEGENLLENIDFLGDLYMGSELNLGNDVKLLRIDKNGKKKEIAKSVLKVSCLNEDGTELLYVTDDGTYIFEDGKKNEKISDDSLFSIYLGKVAFFGCGHFIEVNSIEDTLMIMETDGEKYYCCYMSDYDTVKLVDDCYIIMGGNDKLTKITYFTDEFELRYAELEKNTEGKSLGEHVSYCRMTSDGKSIYYIKSDTMELYYLDENLNDTFIMKLDSVENVCMFENDCYIQCGGVYYLDGGEAYKVSDNGTLDMDYVSEKVYLELDNGEIYILDKDEKKEIK